MKDLNLRRFLYFAGQEHASQGTWSPQHFAILKRKDEARDSFNETILGAYGVQIIWIDKFSDIEHVLRDVYTAVDGVTDDDWERLRKMERSG